MNKPPHILKLATEYVNSKKNLESKILMMYKKKYHTQNLDE